MFTKIFQELNLSKNTCYIYTHLLESGMMSARKLAENLNMPRPSIYDHLKILIKNGLVIEREEEGKKLFGIDDINDIPQLITTKIESLEQEKKTAIEALKNIKKEIGTLDPKIKFYPGIEGIKQVLKNLLWYENIETYTMWPIYDMVEILGKEYLEQLNRRRIKQNISIKGIWPYDKKISFKDYPFLGVGKKHLRSLCFAPQNMTWDMSYWLYADKVAFISSKREGFGFVIHSRDFVNLLKMQFDVIWKISKPIQPQPQYTNSFFE